MNQLVILIVAGIIVELVVRNSAAIVASPNAGVNQTTTPLAAAAAASNAKASNNVGPSNLTDAQSYDLNYYPNSSGETAAASGVDTGNLDMPNATPTFVSPDQGDI